MTLVSTATSSVLLRARRADRARASSDFGDLRSSAAPAAHRRAPRARAAAGAAEAAAEQCVLGDDDLLLDHQDESAADLIHYAGPGPTSTGSAAFGLYGCEPHCEDIDTADLSGVSGTPTFFINGRRHYGAYDIDTLSSEVRIARARAAISA